MTFHCVLIYLLVDGLWKSTFYNIVGGSYRLWKSTFGNIVGGSCWLYRLLADGIMNLFIQYPEF